MQKKSAFLFILLLIIGWTGAVYGGSEARFVTAARDQIGKTIQYDPNYKVLAYPNGDVPIDRGVCTDVVIRAMREAFGMDLQVLVHEDMKAHFSNYPDRWGLTIPDKNIDHRRVPNLQTYFKRRGWEETISQSADAYKTGDIVTCTVPPHLPHIMIVSDKKNWHGVPFVIHNIGRGTKEEDCLFTYDITGHYRIRALEQAEAADSADIRSD